jgi:hypothetical protein
MWSFCGRAPQESNPSCRGCSRSTPIDNIGVPSEGARSLVLVKLDPIAGSAERSVRFLNAGYGIELGHRARDQRPPHPHHLRRGSIQADIAGVLLSDVPVELDQLLDHVQVSAQSSVVDPTPK